MAMADAIILATARLTGATSHAGANYAFKRGRPMKSRLPMGVPFMRSMS